jgi:Na+/proline symporter
MSHNLIIPTLGITNERTKVVLARAGVALFGVIAYVLAVRSLGVFALVEQASAFGSTGALVTITFGLFTRFGGPRTALATLTLGLVSYLVASYGNVPHPFLLSFGVALASYLLGGMLEHVLTQERRATAA